MIAACGWIGLADFCTAVADWWHIIMWGLLWLGVVVASWVVGWYFAFLRPFLGFIVFVLGGFIAGMIKGISDQKKRANARIRQPAPRPQPQQQPPTIPFAWLWEWR